MDISQLVNDRSNAILQINGPNSKQINIVKEAIEDAGLKTNNFLIPTNELLFANIEYLRSSIKRTVREGTEVIFLEFELPPNEKNFLGTKIIIDELKEITPQMIVTIFKPGVRENDKKSQIDYFYSSKELIEELRNRYINDKNQENVLDHNLKLDVPSYKPRLR